MKSATLTCITTMTLLAALVVPVRLAAQDKQQQEQKKKHTRYKLVDLGTLGGSQSFPGISNVQVLNNQGIGAGCAEMSTPDTDYLLSGPALPFPSAPDPLIFHTFEWQNGTLTDLGALPGVNSSCANWISGNGVLLRMSDGSLSSEDV